MRTEAGAPAGSTPGHVLYHFEPVASAVLGGARQVGEALKALEAQGVIVDYLQTPARPRRRVKYNPILSNIWYLMFCLGRVRREADVLAIDYGGRVHTLLFVALVRRLRAARLAVFVQALNSAYRRSRLRNLLDRLVSGFFLRQADVVLIAGTALREEMLRLGVSPNRIRTIYPALREELRAYLPRERRPARRDRVVVLCVGRVHPIKGLEYLIDAMVAFKGMANVGLMLVGDDTLVPWYTRKLEDQIRRHGLDAQVERRGRIDRVDQLAAAYREADIFALPTVWDTSPIAVLEAMCFGLPVVTTTAGGAGEWVEDGCSGILVPAHNARQLRGAIGRLINDPDLRERMGEAGAERSRRFRDRTWDDVRLEYYEAFRPLLGGARPRWSLGRA